MGSGDWTVYLRAFFALTFVVGLIYLLAAFVKKAGLDKRLTGVKGAARLQLSETLYLDSKRRLVLVKSDNREHLLLLSAGGDVVVESRERKMPDA